MEFLYRQRSSYLAKPTNLRPVKTHNDDGCRALSPVRIYWTKMRLLRVSRLAGGRLPFLFVLEQSSLSLLKRLEKPLNKIPVSID